MPTTEKITVCLNQSYNGVRESLMVGVLPKIIHALSETPGKSFVVEFSREMTKEEACYGDYAHVTFKTQTPMVFGDKPEGN